MDTAQWPQDLGLLKPMEDLIMSSSTSSNNTTNPTRPPPQVMERRVRPQKEQALNCPRCNSTNTKFCYYNNYSLTQPRYFCKTCRRYWTEGGSLRNVPVGGGSRKNKRSSSSSSSAPSSSSSASSSLSATTSTSLPAPISCSLSSSSSSSKKLMAHDTMLASTQNPKFQEGQDLNLAFTLPEFGASCTNINTSTSAMELLRGGGIQGRGMSPFMAPMNPMAVPEFTSGFNTLSFPLDGVNGGGGASGVTYSMHENNGRLLFPFEETRHVNSSNAHGASDHFEQNKGQSGGGDPPGFWSGLLGVGGGGGGGGGGAW